MITSIKEIRKLARDLQSQNLFVMSKEIYGIRLFENDKDFSGLQMNYLSLLSHYNFLNREVDMDEVSDLVLKEDIYGDSYVYWKQKKGNEYLKNKMKTKNKSHSKENSGKHLKIVFN